MPVPVHRNVCISEISRLKSMERTQCDFLSSCFNKIPQLMKRFSQRAVRLDLLLVVATNIFRHLVGSVLVSAMRKREFNIAIERDAPVLSFVGEKVYCRRPSIA